MNSVPTLRTLTRVLLRKVRGLCQLNVVLLRHRTGLLILSAVIPNFSNVAVAESRSVAVHSEMNFGTVDEGQPVKAEFQIRNDGDTPLQILKIQTSCGCTLVAPTAMTVAPGAVLTLPTTFETTGFTGSKVKTVRVYTNDSKRDSLLFSLKGTVRPTLKVEPSRLFWGEIPQGKSASQKLEVSVPSSSDVQVTAIETRSPLMEVTTAPFAENGRKGLRGVVTLLSSAPLGSIEGRLVISTTSPSAPKANMYAFGNIVGELRPSMTEVSFGLLAGPLKAEKQAILKLRSLSNKQISIEQIDSDTAGVSAESRPLRSGIEQEIIVSLSEGMFGTTRARLKISATVDGKEVPDLDIPVFAIIAKQGD